MTNLELLDILEEPRILKYAVRYKCPHIIATKYDGVCTCTICNEKLNNLDNTYVIETSNENEIRLFIKQELSELLQVEPALELPKIIGIILEDLERKQNELKK